MVTKRILEIQNAVTLTLMIHCIGSRIYLTSVQI